MGYVIGAVVAAVAVYYFAGMRKMARWNNDPGQIKLVQLLAAEASSHFDTSASCMAYINLVNFICEAPWRALETKKRLAHALTILQRKAPPAIYEKARERVLERSSDWLAERTRRRSVTMITDAQTALDEHKRTFASSQMPLPKESQDKVFSVIAIVFIAGVILMFVAEFLQKWGWQVLP